VPLAELLKHIWINIQPTKNDGGWRAGKASEGRRHASGQPYLISEQWKECLNKNQDHKRVRVSLLFIDAAYPTHYDILTEILNLHSNRRQLRIQKLGKLMAERAR
jgi:hypothetical protein